MTGEKMEEDKRKGGRKGNGKANEELDEVAKRATKSGDGSKGCPRAKQPQKWSAVGILIPSQKHGSAKVPWGECTRVKGAPRVV